jgi:hypothetical protein
MDRAYGYGSIAIAFTLLPMLLACGNSRNSRTPTVQIAPKQDPNLYASFYTGRPVSDPEALSGIWEAGDGRGGAVGIDLRLITYLPRDARSFKGTGETWQSLQVGVYERALSTIRLGEENYFSDFKRVGDVRYENGRLTLHSGPFDLDLVRLPGQRWSGRLHRKDFDAKVVLTRFGANPAHQHAGFVGTWRRDWGTGFACLHIAQPVPGEFTVWEDSHQVPGLMRYAPAVPISATVTQIYGDMIVARLTAEGNLLLESPASLAGCCRHSWVATLTKHGMQIREVAGPEGPGWLLDRADWRRVPGPNCIVPNRPAH